MPEEELTPQEETVLPDPAPPDPTPPPADPDSELRRELDLARARVEELERERLLISKGVPEEDLDYYVFKIGRLVTPEKDFATAAKDYLRQHRPRPVLNTAASLTPTAAPTPQSPNDVMNKLLRGK